jgi:hypothetical protein
VAARDLVAETADVPNNVDLYVRNEGVAKLDVVDVPSPRNSRVDPLALGVDVLPKEDHYVTEPLAETKPTMTPHASFRRDT